MSLDGSRLYNFSLPRYPSLCFTYSFGFGFGFGSAYATNSLMLFLSLMCVRLILDSVVKMKGARNWVT